MLAKTTKITAKPALKLLITAFIAFAATKPLDAQIIKGTISGTDGFPINEVSVVLSHPDGTKDSTKTDSNGYFTMGKATTVGIEQIAGKQGLFYRLTGNELYLKYNAAIKEGAVYSLSGKTNTRFKLNNATEGRVKLNNSPETVYILKLSTAKGIISAKILNTNNYTALPALKTNKNSTSKNKSTNDNGNHLLNAAKSDYKTQEISLNDLDQAQEYDHNDFVLHFTDKNFNQVIISENEKGEKIAVAYEIKDALTDEVLATGSTGANGLDTLQITKEYPAATDLEVSIYTTSTDQEIENASRANFWGQETLQENITVNPTKRYDYLLDISASDAENSNPLSQFSIVLYIDNQQIAATESLEATLVNLKLEQYPNNTPLKIITSKEDFINDTTETILLKTELNPQLNINLNPILYNFSIGINASDAEQSTPLTGFTATVYTGSTEIATGYSGTNTSLALNLGNLRNNSPVTIISTKPDYQTDTTIISLLKTELNSQINSVLNPVYYHFSISASATHNLTFENLDSLTVTAYKQSGEQLASAASGENTSLNFDISAKNNSIIELVWARNGFKNDTTTETLTSAKLNPEYSTTLDTIKTYAIIWHKAVDEIGSGATFDVKITAPNYTKTFTVNNETWYRDTIPTQEGIPVNATIEYTPQTVQGGIPLYPKTINITIPEGTTDEGRDTIKALEQNKNLNMRIYDFENQTGTKEANIKIQDLQGNITFQGMTTNGQILTNYMPVGEEGTGFEGMITITPTDNTYFGTKVVIDAGDWTIQNENDLYNILGTAYKGYEMKMPLIQTNFNRTDDVAIYLVKQTREDPLTGTILQMNPYEIIEMEGNEINVELARYQEENVYFVETDTRYQAYREHAREIFGYPFIENEVETQRNETSQINDYSVDNDNYKTALGWNIYFGDNSTGTATINPPLFGKAGISSRGRVGYDFTNLAGCAREDGRRIGMGTVWSRDSYMSTSLPPNFPDDLNIEDRTITNLILWYRETQVKQNEAERNISNLGYLFVP